MLKARHSPAQVEIPYLMREGVWERRVRGAFFLVAEGVEGDGVCILVCEGMFCCLFEWCRGGNRGMR